MKYFEIEYRQRGKKQRITLAALTRAEALNAFKIHQKAVPSRIKEIAPPLSVRLSQIKALLNPSMSKIKPENLIASFRQISVMSGAGIPFNDILLETASSTPDKALELLFKNALDDINGGMNFSESLSRYKHELGSLTISMVELGEKTGQMAESLATLADILEEIQQNRAKIKKALRYPMMTLSAMAIAFTILIMLVVPKFKDTFDKLGAELPLPTKILLGMEYTISHFGLIFIVLGMGAIVGGKYYYQHNKDFRLWFDRKILGVYLIGKIIYLATLTRFTIVFGELIKAGLPLSESIITATGIVDNSYMRSKLSGIVVAVGRGISLTHALQETGLYERMTVQMISAGENSGTLDIMFKRVADYYRMKFNAIVDNISVYIEPILIFLIAGLITLLALGIFMPIWGLAQAAHH